MCKRNESLQEILAGREERAKIIHDLNERYAGTIVSFTINIPGEDKRQPAYEILHEEGQKLIENAFVCESYHVIDKKLHESAAGYEAFYCITKDALTIKKITSVIEETHVLGRLFDFDVFDEKLKKLSRKEIGIEERRCLICDKKAQVCGRSRAHALEELQHKINDIIYSFFDIYTR